MISLLQFVQLQIFMRNECLQHDLSQPAQIMNCSLPMIQWIDYNFLFPGKKNLDTKYVVKEEEKNLAMSHASIDKIWKKDKML